MKKIVILGSTGMLGSMLLEYFSSTNKYEITSSVRNIDFESNNNFLFDPLINYMSELPYADYFINAIGTIKPFMSKNMSDSIYLNALFPRDLADECNKKRIKLVHITTDCVFNGLKGSYSELDDHDATDVYGVSKSLGEPEGSTIIRTSIIGEETRNFSSLLEWVKSNRDKEVDGYTNHIWNGITCLQFAKICRDIIHSGKFWRGVKHITSPNTINKFDLVRLISDVYNLNVRITPHKTEVKCDRSLVSIRGDVVFEVPELKEQLLKMKYFRNILEE